MKSGIVTGGASGIGEEIVSQLAAGGANVIIADIDSERGSRMADKLNKAGNRCRFVHCDVTNPGDCEQAVDRCLSCFNKLEFLVNSAGTVAAGPTSRMSLENWNKVIDTNLRGTFLMTKYAIPHLTQNGGSIVNIASIAGLVGFRNISAYCASKGGVIAFTRSLALELASSNVRVNCVCPGSVNTPFMDMLVGQSKDKRAATAHSTTKTPIRRIGQPSEIAPLVLFLIDERRSSYMTGSILSIDGGYIAQ
jgi:dihydroanticapsin dehydrogenase